jgi:ABC-type amino acid transport substrate-binding protein
MALAVALLVSVSAQAWHAMRRHDRRQQALHLSGQDHAAVQREMALKAFVDQWLHISMEDGSYKKIYAAWID